MDISKACADIIIGEFPGIYGIWLFGSTVSGLACAGSDIDLAILPAGKIDKVRIWQCSQRIASAIGKDVDQVDLLDASTVMRAQIIESGKRIYCADQFVCDKFETEVLTDYLRFAESRKELIEDIRSRGKVFGND